MNNIILLYQYNIFFNYLFTDEYRVLVKSDELLNRDSISILKL